MFFLQTICARNNSAPLQTAVGGMLGADMSCLVSLAVTRNQQLSNILVECGKIHTDMVDILDNMSFKLNKL